MDSIIDSDCTISASQVSDLIRRICAEFSVAFSENKIHPVLADFHDGNQFFNPVEILKAVGNRFGIRFQEVGGTFDEMIEAAGDSQIIAAPLQIDDQEGLSKSTYVLVLRAVGRKGFLIHRQGRDEFVSRTWLKKSLKPAGQGAFQWLIIQRLLPAEAASSFSNESGTQTDPPKPLRRLLAYIQPEAKDIRTIFVFSIVIGLLSLTTPLAVEAVVNTIAFGRYLQPLVILSLIVFIFLVFRAGLGILTAVVAEVIQRRLFVRTVLDLSHRLTRVPLTHWRKYYGPELANRFFDIVTIQKITSKLLLETLMLVLQTVIGLTVLAFYHPFLLGYDIGLLAMMTIVLLLIGRGAVKTAQKESQLKYETAAWLQEIVRHPETFKFNRGLEFAVNRADELAANYINERQRHFRILLRQISFSMFMQVIAATVLLGLGGYLVIDGQMTLGQLVAAELIVTVILGSFAKLGKDLESFYDLLASVDKLGKLFDLPVERTDKLRMARNDGASSVDLAGVRLNSIATKRFNLRIRPGQSVAVTGINELSRRELCEILIGQQKPGAGHVLVNQYRVDSLNPESLQEQVCLVREADLFDGTLDDNIRMGRAGIGSDQVNSIVDALGLQHCVARLEEGLLGRVYVSGYPLSQNETVRLVLARALIARPGILLIDGLIDRLSDTDIDDIIRRLDRFKPLTTIVIASGRAAIGRWADVELNLDTNTPANGKV